MSWIRATRARLATLRRWAARTFLRPDSVTLVYRPPGTAETGRTATLGDPTI